MAFELSFSQEFFWGEGDEDWQVKSDRPTNVAQALFSMSNDDWAAMLEECLPDRDFVRDANGSCTVRPTSSMSDVHAVMDLIRETNTCGDLTSPIEVWIDPEGWHYVRVY